MGIVERARIKAGEIRKWWLLNHDNDYRFLRRHNNGIAVGFPLKIFCLTSAIMRDVNGNNEIFYDINKIFYLCRRRLAKERIEKNLKADSFKSVSTTRIMGRRITIITFQPCVVQLRDKKI